MGASLQVRTSLAATDERRVVTVMFADLVGSTALAERLDAEEMRHVLTELFGALGREVVALEGTIDKYNENDAARAITAGWRMQRTMQRLNPELERRYGARLALRVGINSGEVVAGNLAPSVQTAYTVVGDTVNVAKRFAQAAEPGEILIGATTQRLARGFDLEVHAPVTAKGKSAPIQVFAVHGIAPGHTPPIPLIGRRAEAAIARGAVDRVLDGAGSALAIVGEAGIGKSRLIEHARDEARSAGVAWLEGHALEHARHISYWPFRESLRAQASIADDDDDVVKWSKLSANAGQLLGAQTNEVLPYLGLLGGIRAPAEVAKKTEALDGEARRRQVLRAAYLYFEAFARRGPAVLALEDLHWADVSSQRLLDHLLPLTDRLLICWTTRRQAAGPAAGSSRSTAFTEIKLGPLNDRECTDLVTAFAGERVIEPSQRSHIVARSAGNPFFAQQLVLASLDLQVPDLPQSIQASITARLDALPEATRDVARLASVIGRSFSSRLVEAIAPVHANVSAALVDLTTHGLVRQGSTSDGRDYSFTHALVQEAAYAGIVLDQRRRLHGHVAAALESRATSHEEIAGTLAYHYSRAESWEKAQAFLFSLGDQALRIAADVEALDHYEQALQAYSKAFGQASDPLSRATIERHPRDEASRCDARDAWRPPARESGRCTRRHRARIVRTARASSGSRVPPSVGRHRHIEGGLARPVAPAGSRLRLGPRASVLRRPSHAESLGTTTPIPRCAPRLLRDDADGTQHRARWLGIHLRKDGEAGRRVTR
ncbi:MAG: hypothetical protein AUH85_18440 [Chloroflexi bacterium 13_1_40CM_4_68_4]|nr:MAG: hypothetical protein AUH85_18440 [Chloroflexi bacterium 13_1_40CM_4_68_4]